MRSFFPLGLTVLLIAGACGSGEDDRPPLFIGNGGSDGGSYGPVLGGKAGTDDCGEAPAFEPTGLCGSEVVPVLAEKPNLYFLVDTSGSMLEPISTSGPLTKLAAAKQALLTVVSELGHRVSYGLARYPGEAIDGALSGCGPGEEVFETQEGDPLDACGKSDNGPTTEAFAEVVLGLNAEGGTPLSATLLELSDTVTDLNGKTVLILMTDGAPNCNNEQPCSADECSWNVEGAAFSGVECDDSFNCCDPANEETTRLVFAQSYCVDVDPSEGEIEKLEADGVSTYVIGVPGTEAYTEVMNRLAEAGGTARDGDVAYYDATDLEELTDTLRNIGSEIAQSCEVSLSEDPMEPNLLNVYLDTNLLARDEVDGWTLDGKVVTLHGDACAQVRKGDVSDIRLVSGCATVVK